MELTWQTRWFLRLSSPSDRRCAAGGSPSPCWWSRRCPTRWSGRPSRRGWGSLGWRMEVSQEEKADWDCYLLRLVGTLLVSSPSSSCVPPVGPAVGWSLAGRGWGPSWTWGCWAAGGGRRVAWSPGSWVLAETVLLTHTEFLYPGRYKVLKDKDRSVKSFGLWLE